MTDPSKISQKLIFNRKLSCIKLWGVIRSHQCSMNAIKRRCIGEAVLLYQGLHAGQFRNKVKNCVHT